MQSEQINELSKALTKVQNEMRGATKNNRNSHLGTPFADLNSIWEAIHGPLSTNGFSISQTTDVDQNGRGLLVTTLMHSSGQWIQGRLPILMGGKADDPQKLGAGITYARRYALNAILCIPQVDDDGEFAATHEQEKETKAPEPVKFQERSTTSSHDYVPSPIKGDPGEYTVTFGKYEGQQIKSQPVREHKSYIEYLKSEAKKKNKQLQGKVKDYVDNASAYISKQENGHADYGELQF